MPVLIDGYNLLWAIQEASPVRSNRSRYRYRLNHYQPTSDGASEASHPITDVKLCRILGRYLEQTNDKGQIVFDGTGPPDKSGFDNISNLEVFFTGLGTDADTVIEDKIKASTSPKRLTVVSGDRRLRKAALARKAIAVKSEVFWKNLRKQSGGKEKIKEPAEKCQGLNESETEQWLRLFGFEQ